jgi:hypothetical protein
MLPNVLHDAQKAAKKFAALGYPVKEIIGDYESWVEYKYPLEFDRKVKNKGFPFDLGAFRA